MKRRAFGLAISIMLIAAMAVSSLTTDVHASGNQSSYWSGKYRQIDKLSDLNKDAIIIKSGGIQSGNLLIDIKKTKIKKKKKTTVQLWSSNNTANQRFSLVGNGDGTYRITALRYGQVITVKDHRVKRGAKMTLAKYANKKSQKWRIISDKPTGTFTIVSAANENLLLGCRTVRKSSELQLVEEGNNTDFTFLKPVPAIPNGTYSFINKASTNLRLNIKKSSKKNGANIELRRGSVSNSKIFMITWDKRVGYYSIKNVRSNKVFDVKKGKTKPGTYVQQWSKNGKFAQYWMLEHAKDGNGYYIRYAANGMQLSAKKNKIKNGSKAVIQTSSTSKNRAWLIRTAIPGSKSANTGSKLAIPTDWYGNAKDDYQAYHPKVVNFDHSWNGYRYWMAYTPYPNSNADYEDPCIATSNDLINWVVPEGLTNPIHDTHTDGVYGWHNSDTHLLYNPDNQKLELFWRYVKGEDRIIYRSTSEDGIHWSDKEIAISGSSSSDIISPAIIYEEGLYRMWYVRNSKGRVCYRESSNGTNWSQETTLHIPYGYTEMKTWHLDVEKTSKGYEALLSAYDEWDNRNRMDLWYSYSADGVNSWSVPKIILRPSTGSKYWDNMGIYRSCLLKNNGKYYLFYGGTSNKFAHGIGLLCGDSIDKLYSIN